MKNYRVLVCMSVEVEASSADVAASKARIHLREMIDDADLVVSEDDGSCWNEVGRFSPTEVKR